MQPEPGDPGIEVDREDVRRAAGEVGIARGDTVMFHSSLSSMGTVVGGPDTVIDGFLEAVGSEGTVAAPTLWWHQTDPPLRMEDWDPDTSPSYPGLITEHFRRRPDSLRSNNPTHSVSAIGARAVELTRDHGATGRRPCVFGDAAFARASPWERLYQWNAAYCFIGVDFTVNTMSHYIETVLVEAALREAQGPLRRKLRARLQARHAEGVWPWYDRTGMEDCLTDRGLVRRGRIGSATLRCIRARDMVDHTLSILRAQPAHWFQANFQAWLAEAEGKADAP
ncbi:MAG: AAC(3) family N-acetyltransferase [Armatimonadetes bacterium]|nr:AAC(3) family N-acetyltransferase [Armatimonadota bacterium]